MQGCPYRSKVGKQSQVLGTQCKSDLFFFLSFFLNFYCLTIWYIKLNIDHCTKEEIRSHVTLVIKSKSLQITLTKA